MKINSFDIIVPCYNTDLELFKRCIYSVINQNYDNYRLIIINDGSKDFTIDDYVKELNNPHILYIRTPNRGSGAARNTGLENLVSDYFMFLDSDDELVSNCLEEINLFINDNNPQMIQFGFYSISPSSKTTHVSSKHSLNKEDILNYDNEIARNWINSSVWNKCFCSKTFSKFRFSPNLTLGEDRVFLLNVFLDDSFSGLKLLNKPLYCYYINENSLSRTLSNKSISKILDYFSEFLSIINRHQSERELNIYLSSLCEDILKITNYYIVSNKTACLSKNKSLVSFIENKCIVNIVSISNTTNLNFKQRFAWFLFKKHLFLIYYLIFIVLKNLKNKLF